MASPSEKLAESLEILRKAQSRNNTAVIRAKDISRTHRERLTANGFLREIIKGWYITSRPDETVQGGTAWYPSFWTFCSEYLRHRFGDEWCLSPEQSLSIHCGNFTIPRQLLVRTPKAKNNITDLPNNISIFDVRASIPARKDIEQKNGINIFSLPSALIACSPNYFSKQVIETRAALSLIKDSSEILPRLLEGGHSKIAGRLAGAFRNAGSERIADDIIKTMKSAGYDIREDDPFNDTLRLISIKKAGSLYSSRIKSLWYHMRQTVIDGCPKGKGLPADAEKYLRHVEEIYASDAYNSLSIEGFKVTPQLIEKIQSGNWSPDTSETDAEYRNALTARGYWQAFQSVKTSISKILDGQNPGAVVESDHRTWYREMFSPFITAGLIKPSNLAGYRSGRVYIRGSRHMPPDPGSVRDAMPSLFELLIEEKEPWVRAVLGHFIFVYIHPYMDGNGRLGRFLMNTMLASGGYQWTVIPIKKRNEYMTALEKASIDQNITAFTGFIAKCVKAGLKGKL